MGLCEKCKEKFGNSYRYLPKIVKEADFPSVVKQKILNVLEETPLDSEIEQLKSRMDKIEKITEVKNEEKKRRRNNKTF